MKGDPVLACRHSDPALREQPTDGQRAGKWGGAQQRGAGTLANIGAESRDVTAAQLEASLGAVLRAQRSLQRARSRKRALLDELNEVGVAVGLMICKAGTSGEQGYGGCAALGLCTKVCW